MSLQSTCQKLFIHKNTLQNRLDRIYEKSGYNPRKFRDAALLYLALKL
ncbi:MAG: helix-turn-helix domain-containing protein [[Clostridium] nexile]